MGGGRCGGIRRPFADLTTRDLLLSLIVEEDRAQFEALSQAGTAKMFHAEYRVRWPNGEIHWLESRGTPSTVDAGIWHGVTIDVTDRKNAELALIRSEKLAAIGRLSATIAHEINNPLEAVTNLLFLALSDRDIHPETRRYLEQADEEVARLASIARHTLTFARTTSSGPANFAAIAESVVSLFQPRCSSRGIEIRLIQKFNSSVAVPPDDLREILTNLVSNACDALTSSAGLIEVEITAEDGFAVIEVRDTGAGIAVEHLDRVFDALRPKRVWAPGLACGCPGNLWRRTAAASACAVEVVGVSDCFSGWSFRWRRLCYSDQLVAASVSASKRARGALLCPTASPFRGRRFPGC